MKPDLIWFVLIMIPICIINFLIRGMSIRETICAVLGMVIGIPTSFLLLYAFAYLVKIFNLQFIADAEPGGVQTIFDIMTVVVCFGIGLFLYKKIFKKEITIFKSKD